MKAKTQKAIDFLDKLHKYIIKDKLLRTNVQNKNEKQIQTELRGIIYRRMVEYFQEQNHTKPKLSADRHFYWEGQQGNYAKDKIETFSARNYPDFIITKPYMIAIEYKKGSSGSLIKHGIGQSLIHTLGGEFDFVYFLFQDESKDKQILKSLNNKKEKLLIERFWNDFNVRLEII